MKTGFEANIGKFYLYKYLRGLWIPAAIWTLYLLARNFNYTQIGFTDIAFAAVIILFEIPSGAFADLVGRKYSVCLGYFLIAISSLFIGLTGKFSFIILALAIFGLGETFVSGAANALIYDTLKILKKEKLYAKIDGRANALFSFGSVCGAFIGAYLFSINISFPYYLGAVVFALAGLSFLAMKEPNQRTAKYNIKEHYTQMIEGCKYVKGHPKVKWIIAFSSIIATIFGYQIFIVSPALTTFGFDVKYFGFLFALIWGIEAIVFWNAHKILDYLGEKKALFAVGIIYAISFTILSMVNFWLALLFIIISYFGRGLFHPVRNNFIQKRIVSSHRATTLSIQSFATSLLSIIATLILSKLTDLLSISKVYLIVGILALVATIVLYLTYPKK